MPDKKTLRKSLLLIAGGLLVLPLGGCTIYSLFSNNQGNVEGLLISNKSASDYSFPTREADSNGTGYSSKTTSVDYEDVSSASGSYVYPSTGTHNILVIPVKVKDYASVCNDTTRQRISDTFFGASSATGWESVASYYAKSSFGNLIINGTVSDWFDCGYTASEIASLSASLTGYDPTWTILEEAVAWYEKKYDTNCASFDYNGDGLIDGVWLVYSAPFYSSGSDLNKNVFWAYTYSDYSVSQVTSTRVGYHYCWASYDFMYEGYGSSQLDAHTYIHETGHLLGLDDYYASSSLPNTRNYAPMGCIDMMDYNVIDHDAFSKFALGWIHPFVVTDACTVTLKPASTSGQAILIPTSDGWNGSAFDEYMLLEYYTPTINNQKDSESAYDNGVRGFTENGVRIYHVDARMAKVTVANGKQNYSYTDTVVPLSDTQGTLMAHSNGNANNVLNPNFRLIQEMDCTSRRNFDATYNTSKNTVWVADNSTLFQNNDRFTFADYKDSFPNYYYNGFATMNNGTTFNWTLSFSETSDQGIQVSISK